MICNSCGNTVDAIHKFCPKCGAPMQFQSPPPAAGPPPYSAPQSPMTPMMSSPMAQPAKKSGCGKIVLIVVLILVLLGCGVAGAIYFGFRYAEKTLKASEAYTVAVKALKENAEVKEKLGEIRETGFPIGAYSQDADGSGKAAFVMSVQGAKASGQYQVELVRSNSVWRVESGVVRTASGETIRVTDNRRNTEDLTDANANSNTNQGNINARGVVNGGVLNGKAIKLPQPVYPQVAKVAKASGTVIVQVLVDEEGNVVSARAVSGHPLLHAAAIAAARSAKFAPTKLSGKLVKVSGTITYNFTPE